MNKRIQKSFLAFGLATLTIVAISFSGCNATSEKEKAANEATEKLIEAQKELEIAKKDYVEKLAAFKMESDNRITENEKSIAKLKADATKMKKAAKEELEAKLNVLEHRNQLLKDKITDYKEESTDNWEAFKIEFNSDMDNLGQALKDLTKDNTK